MKMKAKFEVFSTSRIHHESLGFNLHHPTCGPSCPLLRCCGFCLASSGCAGDKMFEGQGLACLPTVQFRDGQLIHGRGTLR